MNTRILDIVFNEPPGPLTGGFVEVENAYGISVSVGEWVERDDGYWALRIPLPEEGELELLHKIARLAATYIRIHPCPADNRPTGEDCVHERELRSALASWAGVEAT